MLHKYKILCGLLILGSVGGINAEPTPLTFNQGAILALLTTVGANLPTIFNYAKNSFFGAGTPKETTSTVNVLSPIEQKIKDLLPDILEAPANTPDDFKIFTKLTDDKRAKIYSPSNLQSLFECITEEGKFLNLKTYNNCIEPLNRIAASKKSNIPEDIKSHVTEDASQ